MPDEPNTVVRITPAARRSLDEVAARMRWGLTDTLEVALRMAEQASDAELLKAARDRDHPDTNGQAA